MMRTTFPAKVAAVVAAGVLLLAACGDDDNGAGAGTASAASTTPGSATSATTAASGGDTTNPYGGGTTATSGGGTTTPSAGDTSTPLVTTASSDLGEILVGEGGRTVYGFEPDAGGSPTCTGGCASNWPPVLVDGEELPAGLDPAVFSVVENPEGGYQLRAGDWPLYYFAGDSKPGDTNGQGISDHWYVVSPTGELIPG